MDGTQLNSDLRLGFGGRIEFFRGRGGGGGVMSDLCARDLGWLLASVGPDPDFSSMACGSSLVDSMPVALRLLLTHANIMIAAIPAIPATADPVAMPIVRVLILEDEVSLLDLGDTVGTTPDVLATIRPVPVADAVAAKVVEEVDVAVMSASPLSRTQSVSPLQLYPNGQQCDPQVGSCPVRFVV